MDPKVSATYKASQPSRLVFTPLAPGMLTSSASVASSSDRSPSNSASTSS